MTYAELVRLSYHILQSVFDDPSKSCQFFCEKLSITYDQFFRGLEFLVNSKYIDNVSFARGGIGNKIQIAYYEGILPTDKGIAFMKNMEKQFNDKIDRHLSEQSIPSVFISYNWNNDKTAASIENALNGKAIVKRDKNDISVWDSISVFMKSIKKQDFVVLVISDHYLKSMACMFEVMELMKVDDWNTKSMYVVLEDAHFYKSIDRAAYIKYWTDQCTELEAQISHLPPSSTSELNADLRKASEIRDYIGQFLTIVADTSNPDVNIAIQWIVSRVENT